MYENHAMPVSARQIPHNRLRGIASPKSRQPPARMMIVLLCPTTVASAACLRDASVQASLQMKSLMTKGAE